MNRRGLKTPLKYWYMFHKHIQHVYQLFFRITAEGDKRLTADGQDRITADSDY